MLITRSGSVKKFDIFLLGKPAALRSSATEITAIKTELGFTALQLYIRFLCKEKKKLQNQIVNQS